MPIPDPSPQISSLLTLDTAKADLEAQSAQPVQPLISVAIVTFNRAAEVLRAIQSVYDQNYAYFEIVVADNNSSDNTIALIEQQFPQTKIIRLHCNLGASGGRNVALVNCRGDILFNLDDDAILNPDTLTHIVNFLTTANPEVGLVACQVFEEGIYKYPQKSGETTIFEGCGWAIRRTILQQVGYFSDRLFRAAEETDFALNYLVAGYQMWYLSEAIIHHMPSSVRVKEDISFYKCRNELIIILERYPLPLVLPFIIWTLIAQIRYGMSHPSHLIPILKGFCSGLLQIPACFSRRKPVPFNILQKVRFSTMHGSRLAVFFEQGLSVERGQ
jgi:GT2 family glycosyltransferase